MAAPAADVWTHYRRSYPVFTSGMAVDAGGTAWLATDSGLMTFDGSSWATIDTTASSVPPGALTSVAFDAAGAKWFGTKAFGVLKFDGATWTTYGPSNASSPGPCESASDLTFDAQGTLWGLCYFSGDTGNTYYGVQSFDGTTWKYFDAYDSPMPSNGVMGIGIDAADRKWFATRYLSNGSSGNTGKTALTVYDGKTMITYDPPALPLLSFLGLAIAPDGSAWVATVSTSGYGLMHFDGSSWTSHTSSDISFSGGYMPLTVDPQGTVWFSAEGGVGSFDGSTWTLYTSANSGLLGDRVEALTVDGQGRKWFATRDGVSIFDGTSWKSQRFFGDDVPLGSSVNAVAIGPTGTKWFGTGTGAASLDGTSWTIYGRDNSPLAGSVSSAAIDAQGVVWFGMVSGGAASFDGTTWTTYDSSNSGLPVGSVKRVRIDAQGRKWFTTLDGGPFVSETAAVTSFDGTTWTTYDASNSGMGTGLVTDVAFDSLGTAWFSTTAGVNSFDGSSWTAYEYWNSPLPSPLVYSAAIEAGDAKWFATASGVARLSGDAWTIYNSANSGLPGDDVRSLWIDRDGSTWFRVSWSPGVTRFDGTTWSTLAPPVAANGAQPTVNDFAMDAQGTKWLATDDGVYAVRTVRTIRATAGKGGTITPGGSITVPDHGTKTLRVSPKRGYTVARLVVDGKNVGARKTYTFRNCVRDHSVKAYFIGN